MTEAEIDADFDAALLIGFVASVDPDSLPSLTEDALPLLAQRMRGLIAKTRVIPPAACDGSFACEAEAHAEDCYAPHVIPSKFIAAIEQAREALNAVPWWRPFKRQDAARTYRLALLIAALHEGRVIQPDAGPLSGLRDVAPEDETDEWRLRQ